MNRNSGGDLNDYDYDYDTFYGMSVDPFGNDTVVMQSNDGITNTIIGFFYMLIGNLFMQVHGN